jgi:hypothetical protein
MVENALAAAGKRNNQTQTGIPETFVKTIKISEEAFQAISTYLSTS